MPPKSRINERGLVDKMLEAFKKGASIKAACGYAGITQHTYTNWMNWGMEAHEKPVESLTPDEKKYKKFVTLVGEAKAKPVLELLEVIMNSALVSKEVGDAKWLIERLDKSFNKSEIVKADVNKTVHTFDFSKLSESQLGSLLNEDLDLQVDFDPPEFGGIDEGDEDDSDK